jgi:hypothetical protein
MMRAQWMRRLAAKFDLTMIPASPPAWGNRMSGKASWAAPLHAADMHPGTTHRHGGNRHGTITNTPGNQARLSRLRATAEPMDARARQAAERSLGVSLRETRIARGAQAEALTSDHAARAMAIGDLVALGRGADDRTLAHELIHVAQMRRHGVAAARQVSQHDDPAEREARLLAPRVLSPAPERISVSAVPRAIVHRDDGPETAGTESEDSASEVMMRVLAQSPRSPALSTANASSSLPPGRHPAVSLVQPAARRQVVVEEERQRLLQLLGGQAPSAAQLAQLREAVARRGADLGEADTGPADHVGAAPDRTSLVLPEAQPGSFADSLASADRQGRQIQTLVNAEMLRLLGFFRGHGLDQRQLMRLRGLAEGNAREEVGRAHPQLANTRGFIRYNRGARGAGQLVRLEFDLPTPSTSELRGIAAAWQPTDPEPMLRLAARASALADRRDPPPISPRAEPAAPDPDQQVMLADGSVVLQREIPRIAARTQYERMRQRSDNPFSAALSEAGGAVAELLGADPEQIEAARDLGALTGQLGLLVPGTQVPADETPARPTVTLVEPTVGRPRQPAFGGYGAPAAAGSSAVPRVASGTTPGTATRWAAYRPAGSETPSASPARTEGEHQVFAGVEGDRSPYRRAQADYRSMTVETPEREAGHGFILGSNVHVTAQGGTTEVSLSGRETRSRLGTQAPPTGLPMIAFVHSHPPSMPFEQARWPSVTDCISLYREFLAVSEYRGQRNADPSLIRRRGGTFRTSAPLSTLVEATQPNGQRATTRVGIDPVATEGPWFVELASGEHAREPRRWFPSLEALARDGLRRAGLQPESIPDDLQGEWFREPATHPAIPSAIRAAQGQSTPAPDSEVRLRGHPPSVEALVASLQRMPRLPSPTQGGAIARATARVRASLQARETRVRLQIDPWLDHVREVLRQAYRRPDDGPSETERAFDVERAATGLIGNVIHSAEQRAGFELTDDERTRLRAALVRDLDQLTAAAAHAFAMRIAPDAPDVLIPAMGQRTTSDSLRGAPGVRRR